MNGPADARTLAVVNPAAGRGRGRRHTDELVRLLREAGRRVEIVHTSEPGDGARLAREAADAGYARVVAVGGDGMVHDVVNGLLGTSTALAIVPLGSANDFAASLGMPEWREAARLALLGRSRPVDAALANGRAFINAAGVGVDAAGARILEAHKRYFGPLCYVTAAVATLAVHRPRPSRVSVNGERFEGRHLLVVVANTERFGNGMRIAPNAVCDDGLLDVCIIGDTSAVEQLALFPRVYRGAHVGHPKVRLIRTRALVIEQEDELPVEMDGEVSTAGRLEVECVPGGIQVVVA